MSTDTRSSAYRRQLDSALHELMDVHDMVERDLVEQGTVSEENHAYFEEAVMAMRRRLLPFVEQGDVTEEWRNHNLDLIPELCAQIIEHNEKTIGHFGVPVEKDDEIRRAPVGNLQYWSEAMIEIYSKLGFTPEVDKKSGEWEI